MRVIINEGFQRDKNDPNSRRSVVTKRQLDPEVWSLSQYIDATGAHVLTRGRFSDQFSANEENDPQPRWRDRSGTVFVRDSAVRLAALNRAAGKCEYCNVEGFRTDGGGIYLETHHIVPLADGGPDSAQNVIALCPNHHREAHHGQARVSLMSEFQALIRRSPG